jgi:hypothetical protein
VGGDPAGRALPETEPDVFAGEDFEVALVFEEDELCDEEGHVAEVVTAGVVVGVLVVEGGVPAVGVVGLGEVELLEGELVVDAEGVDLDEALGAQEEPAGLEDPEVEFAAVFGNAGGHIGHAAEDVQQICLLEHLMRVPLVVDCVFKSVVVVLRVAVQQQDFRAEGRRCIVDGLHFSTCMCSTLTTLRCPSSPS